jgi:hypothetical protein
LIRILYYDGKECFKAADSIGYLGRNAIVRHEFKLGGGKCQVPLRVYEGG